MKKLAFALALIIGLAIPALAEVVTFEWDANTEEDLAGYRLYTSHVSGQYPFGDVSQAIEIGPSETTIDVDIPESDEIYYFVLTAYDYAGNESGPSNEVELHIPIIDRIPPDAPVNFRGWLKKQLSIIINWLRRWA